MFLFEIIKGSFFVVLVIEIEAQLHQEAAGWLSHSAMANTGINL